MSLFVAVTIPNRRPNPNGNGCGNVQKNGPEAGSCCTQWVSVRSDIGPFSACRDCVCGRGRGIAGKLPVLIPAKGYAEARDAQGFH